MEGKMISLACNAVLATVLATGTTHTWCAGTLREGGATIDTTVEFVLDRVGGLCLQPSGDAALCRLTIVVRDDGSWSATGTQPPAPADGAIDSGAASRLAAVVEARWEELTARPFTATCPTAYDGQEVRYVVRRLPAGPGGGLAGAVVRELRSCTYDLEHPGAREVLDRLGALWQELGLPPIA